MIANALPLGASSSGEIVDFELTEQLDVESFRERLAAQLPSEVPLYRVEEVDLKAPSATQALERAEYLIRVAPVEGVSVEQWQDWVEQILTSEAIWWEKTTKSGKKKQVNLRDRLFELELDKSHGDEVVLRYVGSCRNDGTLLRPEYLVWMLEQVAQRELQLSHAHRQRLILAEV
jgi:radical SAM-linked protein